MRQRNARGEGSRLRLEIVQATIRLIDDGTDRLTLRAIAREAGIAGPSIYDHFPDLEGIRTEVIRSCYEDLIERIRQAQDGVADPVERLDVTCFAYTSFGVDFPNRYALLFRGERDQDEKLAVGDRGAAALQTLVDSIAICIEAGRSTSADPYDDALAVWSAIHGLTTLRSSRPHFTRLHRDELMRSVIHRLACITTSTTLQLDHEDFSIQQVSNFPDRKRSKAGPVRAGTNGPLIRTPLGSHASLTSGSAKQARKTPGECEGCYGDVTAARAD